MQRCRDRDMGGRSAWCDISGAAAPSLAPHGIDHRTAKRRLHAVDREGRLFVGIDAIALAAQVTGAHRQLARLLKYRAGRAVAGLVYERLVSAAFFRWAERRLAKRPQAEDPDAAVVPVGVYYNGDCPVCRPEIAHYQRRAHAAGAPFVWHDLAKRPDALRPRGIDGETAKRRLHLIDAQGEVRVGVDAFAVLWGRLPGYRWLGRLVQRPLIRPAAALLYDRVLAPTLALVNAVRAKRRGDSAAARNVDKA
jgi:predicted DCC family thiol-disulfide oxidoreductase YuxK